MNEQKDIIVRKRNFEEKKGEGLNSESHKITFGEKLQETLEDKNEQFGDRLKREIKNKNMSIDELAIKTGICRGAISNYIRKKTKPKVKTMIRIERALDISLEEFYPDINNVKGFIDKLILILYSKKIDFIKFSELLKISEETFLKYIYEEEIPDLELVHQMEEILNVSFKKYYKKFKTKTDEPQTFGKILKSNLKAKKKSVKEIANLLNLSQSTIYDYTLDKRLPKVKTIHEIEKILNVSFEEYYSA